DRHHQPCGGLGRDAISCSREVNARRGGGVKAARWLPTSGDFAECQTPRRFPPSGEPLCPCSSFRRKAESRALWCPLFLCSSFQRKLESILPLLVIAAKAGIQCLWFSLVSLLVIPAKAGIQFLVLALVVCRCVRSAATERNESEELDSSFRWNDEPK